FFLPLSLAAHHPIPAAKVPALQTPSLNTNTPYRTGTYIKHQKQNIQQKITALVQCDHLQRSGGITCRPGATRGRCGGCTAADTAFVGTALACSGPTVSICPAEVPAAVRNIDIHCHRPPLRPYKYAK